MIRTETPSALVSTVRIAGRWETAVVPNDGSDFEPVRHAGEAEARAYHDATVARLTAPAAPKRRKAAPVEPLLIQGANVRVRADGEDWAVLDLRDVDNEDTMIQRGARSVRAFYRWAVAHRAELGTMTFSQVRDVLKAEGIAYHRFYAMD